MSENSFGLLNRVEFTLFLDKERTCIRCRERFTLRHNLGTLACTGFHPLPPTPDGREYPCCHRRPGSDGCCGADHLDHVNIHKRPPSFEATNRTVLTFEQFRLLAVTAAESDLFVNPKTWVRSDKRAVFVIDRIDFARYYEQRNLMAKNNAAPPTYALERWRPDGGVNDWRVMWVVCAEGRRC